MPKAIVFFLNFKPTHRIKTEITPPLFEFIKANLKRGIGSRSVGKTIDRVSDAPHKNNPFLDSINIIT
jgi:hypothetical protein